MSHAVQTLVAADKEHGEACYRISLDSLVLPFSIGAYEHERDRPQRVRIDLELTIGQDLSTLRDSLSEVLSYDDLLGQIERMARGRHIVLLETLVAEIAALCFAADARVQAVSISARKLDVFAGRAVPGVHCAMTRPGRRNTVGGATGRGPRSIL